MSPNKFRANLPFIAKPNSSNDPEKMTPKIIHWILPATLLWVAGARAEQNFFDRIDLNDYALGINLNTSESRYAGVDSSTILYPSPQSFEHSLRTSDVFFTHGANVGLRRVTSDGWTFGGLLGLQTYGYGSNQAEILIGMARRNWTVQAGGLLGRRLGRLHLTLDGVADILGEHNGYELSLAAAVVFAGERWEFIPEVRASWESEKLLNHYFGVRDNEAIPGRPAYRLGAATTLSGSFDWSWRLSPRWYVSATAAVDVLPDEVRNSPLVDKGAIWRVNLGLAYDAAAFVEKSDLDDASSFYVSAGAFFSTAESSIDFLDDGDAVSLDLESESGLADDKTSIPIDVVWELGRHHRIEASYFNLNRSAVVDGIRTDFDTRTLSFGYGFSFLRDKQKDLSLYGGLHVTEIEFSSGEPTDALAASTTAYLPVLGVRFRANLTERLELGASLDVFLSDFDRHSGSSIDVDFSGMYAFTDWLSLGGGFPFFPSGYRCCRRYVSRRFSG